MIRNTSGYTRMVYGTAKNPIAPALNTSAGTAINVYAVYKSPPSRNQVTTVPKRPPASPHSCRRFMSPRRQRAETNPIPVTSANSAIMTPSATTFTWPSGFGESMARRRSRVSVRDVRAPGTFGRINRNRYDGADYYPEELIPVKERYPVQRRLNRCVAGNPERANVWNDQQKRDRASPSAFALDRRIGTGIHPGSASLRSSGKLRPIGQVGNREIDLPHVA